MFLYDLPLEELRTFTLPLTRQPDFVDFWERVRENSAQQPLDTGTTPVRYPVPEASVRKISFSAYDGGRVTGWSITPKPVKPRPALIVFHGYGGDKGEVADYLGWALQGFTVLAFDVRGQRGDSADFATYPGGHAAGWLTQGILDPDRYYVTRIFADTLRALNTAAEMDEVNPARMGVMGISQGGGLALAAAALDDRPALCIAEVPGFCHIRRTLELTKAAPWTELIAYFQRRPGDLDQAMRTMSYMELNNLAEWVHCPALVSVGLQDELCPPSTIFTVFNRIEAEPKRADTFPFNGHEAGLNRERQIVWARRFLMDEEEQDIEV